MKRTPKREGISQAETPSHKNSSPRGKTDSPDRRVRRTKTLLTNALISLLGTKNIKDISVKELCDAADINRGTFYLHYKDIYDMVEQLELEIMTEFESLISIHAPEKLLYDPYPLIYGVFRLSGENAPLCTALLGKNGDISFPLRMKNLFRQPLFTMWTEVYHRTDTAQFEYFYSFIASGCVGLIESWLFSSPHKSAEEMAKVANDIITTGIRSLTQSTDTALAQQ